MTKAVGSTAAMILMDRGKLNPDTPVAEILPEFAKKQVLEDLRVLERGTSTLHGVHWTA
jgi:CubicO group peptidase (beta-lactamase class C family)